MKAAYFDCFSGVSGNMIVGAFLSAGMPLDYLKAALSRLPIQDEYELISEPVKKLGIGAQYFNVRLQHHHHGGEHHKEHHHEVHAHASHRHLKDIVDLIGQSSLAPCVIDLSLKIFRRLAEAEAKVHCCASEEVHFHEVGAVDAIIDIVGAALGYHYLGIQKVYCSPLHAGSGMVSCGHGLMPIPAPATAELLKGVPFYSTEIRGELVTPTGAAIITTFVSEFGPLPVMNPETIGYGAGTLDLSIPNVVRLYVGSEMDSLEKKTATMIEATIDDMNPEFYPYLIEKLLQAGAADVFLVPVHMKKNRPGILISITSTLSNHQPLFDVIFSESTTIGVRMHPVEGYKLQKSFITIDTRFGEVHVKLGKSGEAVLNIAPEFEDCRLLAEKTGAPLKEIYQEAQSNACRLIKCVEDN